MPQEYTRPVEVAWAAVAWTQFLIAITVIAKEDMNLTWQFFHIFLNTPGALLSDSRPFGSAALLLNVISLALFSFPLAAWHSWERDDFDLGRYRLRARHLAVAAHLVWGFSFLALLCYFNPILAGVAIVFVIVGGAWMGTVGRYKKKT